MSTLNTCTSTTRPASPSDGDMLYETDTYRTIVYYNSTWREYQSSNSPYALDSTNSITVRPHIHLDAAKMNGVDSSGNPSNATSVSTWFSKIGNQKMYQNASSAVFTYYTSGTNSQPYCDMNGDFMHLDPGFTLPYQSEFCMIYVAEAQTKFSPVGPPNENWNHNASWFFQHTNGTFYNYHGMGGGSVSVSGASGLFNSTEAVTVRRTLSGTGYSGTGTNETKIHIKGDDTSGGSYTMKDALTLSRFGRGCNNFTGDGHIYEFLLFGTSLSTTDLNSIGAYLNSRYGLTWTNF